jgi:hypothetical protein
MCGWGRIVRVFRQGFTGHPVTECFINKFINLRSIGRGLFCFKGMTLLIYPYLSYQSQQ